ncbi:MAG: signal peptidase I [Thermoproteota archaeon]
MKFLRRFAEPYRTILEYIFFILFVALIWQVFWFSLSLFLRTDHPLVIVAIDMSPWYITSMTPTLTAGDILLIEGVDPSTLRASTPMHQDGDVIVFKHPYQRHQEWNWWLFRTVEEPDLIVHRVVAKWVSGNNTYLRTKGDHNMSEDPYTISGDQVVGRWVGVKIPLIGLVFLAVQDATGKMILLALLALLLFYEVYISLRNPVQKPM